MGNCKDSKLNGGERIWHNNISIRQWGCSQELESPATSHVKPATESRFSEPCKSDNKDIGNPDERIHDSLPEHYGDEDAIALTGNLDIRVPDVIERDNGLHTQRVKNRGRQRRRHQEKRKKAEPIEMTMGGRTEEPQSRGYRNGKGRFRRVRTPPRPRRDAAQPGQYPERHNPNMLVQICVEQGSNPNLLS
ncbi:hypothetical protein NDU88_009427 [Pleurodeles waltl]|uniref:Uncharacterized protein n=1 Tax=Pleurodeles waltl TaxID=8319 RepID=A0AAV7QRK0_PLEWA|nr:hypothetical protein NDU88_009427 [Pleurodeles waltl]